jgi:uncharacterized protein involved in exopolysaccharide biosynthesis
MVRMKLRVSFFVLLVGLALTGCHRIGAYSATAEVTFRLQPDLHDPDNPVATPAEQIQGHLGLIESPGLLSPVITDLNLNHIWAKRLGKDTALSREEALRYLTEKLKLENPPDTTIIRITAFGDTPREAADIANAIADRYKKLLDVTQETLRKSEVTVTKDLIAQDEVQLKDLQAKATENPTNTSLQESRDNVQRVVDALKGKLQQFGNPSEPAPGSVEILSRAVAPLE